MAGNIPWSRGIPRGVLARPLAFGLHNRWNRGLKAVLEWPVALALVLIFCPVFLVIAWSVRRDGGPALFVQTREGLHGRPIRVYKFRSMRVDACNPDARGSLDATGPRVTPLGQMLRRTGLDELPQLFNVLNGTMSLIGPRPHVFAMQVGDALYTEVVPAYHDRLIARPGITGLAQVRGWCGAVESQHHAAARVTADREYIGRWTPWLDLGIALRTTGILFGHLVGRSAA